MSLKETYYVPRIMQTLELLARGPRRPGEVAEHLAVHQRTARRILARLADEGYVSRPRVMSPYSLTPRFSALAAQSLVHQAVHDSGYAARTEGEHPG